MYVILDTEYYEGIQMCTGVIGYFKSHEDAEKFLYKEGYVLSTDTDDSLEIFGYETKHYVNTIDSNTSFEATIEKLELVEVN